MDLDNDERRLRRARDYVAEEHVRLLAALERQQRRGSGGRANPLVSEATVRTNLALYSRIYFGSIRFDVAPEDVRQLFCQFGAIRSLCLLKDPKAARHRGYGFIEFWAPEAAKLAQSLDDVEVASRSVKVGRPTNFPSELPPGIPRPLPTRLYLGNLPPDLQDAELRSIMEPFGPIALLQLIDPPPIQDAVKHSIAAYVEYERPGDAQNALDALQSFVLCGHRLRLCPTIVGGSVDLCGPDILPGSRSSANDPVGVGGGKGTMIEEAANGQEAKGPPIVSCVMVLRNVISFEELTMLDDQDKAELQEEIAGECAKHGKVLRLILHGSERSLQAAAFVHFASPQDVERAVAVFHERWFDGRLLQAAPFDEDRFMMRDFESEDKDSANKETVP
jgi:RNA recognition motif-containing protein